MNDTLPLIDSTSPKPPSPIKEVTLESFVPDIINASSEKLILVQFWSSRSPASKALTPLLSHVVAAQYGAVLLTKINIDKEPEIAEQMHIQSVPALFAFFQGQPIDGFMGTIPEDQIKTWLETLMKKIGLQAGEGSKTEEINALLTEATEALHNKDAIKAHSLFDQALELDEENAAATAGACRSLIAMGELEAATYLFEKTTEPTRKHKDMGGVKEALALATKAQENKNPEETEKLLVRLQKNNEDHDARFDLAMLFYAENKHEEAVKMLLEIIRHNRTWSDKKANKQLLVFFDAFGQTDPLTLSGRKELAAILFS